MAVIERPIKRVGFSTLWVSSTVNSSGKAGATLLFLAAAAATLTIGFRDPRADYLYEAIVFVLAGIYGSKMMPILPALSLAVIGLWGFVQLGVGATVYRYPTLQASLRLAALAATAWVGFRIAGRLPLLRVFAWFGALVSVVSVLAYFTSPGKILWIFDAPYPDIWGPFLSRNNFAQFLELAMPAALWLALRKGDFVYLSLASVMLASGLASASRAGACILAFEAIVLLILERRSPVARRMALVFAMTTALFAAMPGVSVLAGRLTDSDPFQDRREIAQSTVQMIRSRPWTGFGLGTYSTVYPAYAVFDVGQSVDHAHNDWLEWTAEGGVFFCLLWLSLAVWSIPKVLRNGWGLGVLGCFLHAAVDYPFARLGISAWTFLLIGMLAATEVRKVGREAH